MFLPLSLAKRFLNNYVHIIHPLFPVLNITAFSSLIYAAYNSIQMSKHTGGLVHGQLDCA